MATVPFKSSVSLVAHILVRSSIPIHPEQKKDPGVPRQPNLKVRSAERQRRHSVCPPYRFGISLTNTCASISHLSLPRSG
jgi:hypothetical protein